MKNQIEGQMDLNTALRHTCSIDPSYPCTYYFATQVKYAIEGTTCQNTCCYGCKERTCGYACNARRDLKN